MLIPEISGNDRAMVLSSIIFRLNLTSCVMMLDAQAADNSSLSPSCFLDLLALVAAVHLIRSQSIINPEPNNSESSV